MKGLRPEDSRKVHVKLGTVSSQTVWIHEDDFPLQEGDTVTYADREYGSAYPGRIATIDGQDSVTVDEEFYPHIQMERDGKWSELHEDYV